MSNLKEYDVFFEQVNAQKITVTASSPRAAANKAKREVKDLRPELTCVEWNNHKLKERFVKQAYEL